MKLLVFAHTPPPHHGQSVMVQLMLDGFGGDRRGNGGSQIAVGACSAESSGIECYHVNTRFSADIRDMGVVRYGKILLVFRYCLEAIWCRIRYGVRTFYFAPAPPKRAALYRDWMVMLLCRPFFRHFVHHWHAAGLADWLSKDRSFLTRWVTRALLGRTSLGISLAVANLHDPLWLLTRRVEVVPNGIPDPFPDFDSVLLPKRTARLAARRLLLVGQPIPASIRDSAGPDLAVYRVLFLAHCFREKGFIETLDGVAIARGEFERAGIPLRIHLTVAGEFGSPRDRSDFETRSEAPDLSGIVDYAGFVKGAEKARLLSESDCLCFPTYYVLESFGLVVLEAMAAGLNVIASRWRALPEILPSGYTGFVPVRDSAAVGAAICRMSTEDGSLLRKRFLERFTDISHLSRLRAVLLSLDAFGDPF